MLQFALAGGFISLAFQTVGYAIDHAATHAGLADQVVYNWLSLLFAPIGLLPRLTNPDAPIFASWPTAFLVVIGNAASYAALCRTLQFIFVGLSHGSTSNEADGVNSNSVTRQLPDSAFDFNNV